MSVKSLLYWSCVLLRGMYSRSFSSVTPFVIQEIFRFIRRKNNWSGWFDDRRSCHIQLTMTKTCVFQIQTRNTHILVLILVFSHATRNWIVLNWIGNESETSKWELTHLTIFEYRYTFIIIFVITKRIPLYSFSWVRFRSMMTTELNFR